MRVLVCPQEFKGSLTAREAAEAIARGIRNAWPGTDIDVLPLSDGGPGFLEAMHAAVASELFAVPCRDPLGRTVEGQLLQAGDTVFVEAAQANGLALLAPGELAPLTATTAGVGDLIEAAAGLGPARIVVGVGGSATNDGGTGMAIALGARFLDEEDNELPAGVLPLQLLARIAWRRPLPLRNIDFVVATDVRNTLYGPEGAAAVFGPQKGASAAEVAAIDVSLRAYASVVERSFGDAIADIPGAGAAGGLATGLVAFLGARIASGFDVVAEATGLAARIAGADLVVTGEGSYDRQSSMGKVTGRVRAMAGANNVRSIVLAGLSDETGDDVWTLDRLAQSREESLVRAGALLEQLASLAVAAP